MNPYNFFILKKKIEKILDKIKKKILLKVLICCLKRILKIKTIQHYI